MPRGGYRENAGRKLAVGDKLADAPLYMDFTPEGRKVLQHVLDAAGGLSRNQVFAHLAKYAPRLEFPNDPTRRDAAGRQSGVVFPGKLGDPDKVMKISLPERQRARYVAAQNRTHKSFSDIGEALVRWFGTKETQWPVMPGKDRKRKRPKLAVWAPERGPFRRSRKA